MDANRPTVIIRVGGLWAEKAAPVYAKKFQAENDGVAYRERLGSIWVGSKRMAKRLQPAETVKTATACQVLPFIFAGQRRICTPFSFNLIANPLSGT